MSFTIGINANHADSSICIFEKNKLIFAIEEERINRIKHWAGIPIESIKLGLEYCGIEASKVEEIYINTNPYSNLCQKTIYFTKNFIFSKRAKEIFNRQNKKFNITTEIKKKINLNSGVGLKFTDHHISHIASAFYPSGFSDAVGLSIDGFGDFCSLAIANCKNNKIKIIDKIYFPDSLGVFYEAMTQLMGFEKYGEEYKVMGLSSYGKPIYKDIILNNVFDKNSFLKLNLKYFNHYKKSYAYNFQGAPNQQRLFDNSLKELLFNSEVNVEEKFELQSNIASSCQKIFELYLLKIIEKIKKLNKSKNLVYAGGCALNSLANKKIFKDPFFDNIYIPYAPGDSGGAIGSALVHLSKKYHNFSNLESPYIGPSFSNDYMKKMLERYDLRNYSIQYFKDQNEQINQITKNLIQKKVIGVFWNRMEFGARALGNRSIIASPCFIDMKEIINTKIKRRESFRPFAPAILEECKHEWFKTSNLNPYMSNVEEIIEQKRSLIPAVTHIDGTGRVQSVSKKTNLIFHSLIKKFHTETGVPILLNTSFNENEPIVTKPEHALECFSRTKMDVLVLENYLISRI
jgi:carbamoyltransferase